ncbi:MAG: ABC transporter permease [Verrucomicrobia bacterium]|nr:ABC transporter permease [Verrucomicrobiota bacterium]
MNLFAELKEGLGISWDAIRANKLRSGLTTLGIIIGIVTVTLMGTAIDGFNRAFLQSISAIGSDVLFVQRFGWFIESDEEWVAAERRPEITIAQAREVERQMTLAQAVAPKADSRASVKYKNRSSNMVNVIGTTDQFLLTGGVTVVDGRFFTPGESDSGRAVCVLGANVATNLFPDEPPVGNKIQLGGGALEVIGVLEKQGNFMGPFSADNQVIIPMQQFVSSFWAQPDVQIQVKVNDLRQLEDAKEELRGVMRRIRHVAPADEDNFGIDQQEMFIKMFNRVAGRIAAVGFFITGLSLFVGGIGIMNIMFVSVAERTREIGIRKAIGAKRRTIMVQFLIEAASICLLGGMLGLAIAWPLTLVMAKFMPARMSPLVVAIALLVALMTGLVSGFFPAWRAARMNPVDALRNE